MVGSLPKNSQGFFTSVIKADEIEQVSHNEQRLWMGILIQSLEEDIKIKKTVCVRFFVLKTKDDIKIKHAMQKKKALLVENIEKEHKKEVF